MRSPSLRLVSTRLALALALILGLACTASAQTYTWSGLTSSDWNTGTNWTPAGPPTLGATVLFDATSTANLSTSLNATSFSLATVQLTTVGSAVSIGGAGTLTLTGATGFDLTTAGANLTVTAPVTVDAAASQFWTVNAGRTLTVGATTLSATTPGLEFNGAGNTTFNGLLTTNSAAVLLNSAAGSVSFAGGVNLGAAATFRNNGAGAYTVSGAINPAANLVTFDGTGNLTVSGVVSGSGGLTKTGAGTLTLTNANNSGTGVTTFGGGVVSVAALTNGGVNGPLGAATNASANLVFDGGTLRYTGTASAFIDRGFTLGTAGGTFDVSSATVLLTGVGTGTNTSAFIKAGAGTLILSAAETYTGPTSVTGGILAAGNGGAFGTGTGVANAVSVSSGATLNIGGQAFVASAKVFQITGTGVAGVGAALINTGPSQQSALQFLTLTGDATISAGFGNIASTYRNVLTASGTPGRFDIRPTAYTAGAQNLNLGTSTLTKEGGAVFSLVNVDVAGAGSIVVNSGIFNIEAGTQMTTPGSGTITVNPNGQLTFFSYLGSTNLKPIIVNGGTFGEVFTSANQTIPSAITITGSQNPNFMGNSNTTTLSGVISESSFTGTEIAKRGAATLVFGNPANSFVTPVTIYQGNLQGNYTAVLAGGVAPAAPVALTGTPLGTATTITLAGGTLNIRANGANDATNQQFSLPQAITVNFVPGGVNLGQQATTGGTDKLIVPGTLTFAPASAANGYSVGQNQLTMTQNNNFRLHFLNAVTLNSDTAFNGGDFNFAGDVTAANSFTLLKIGGSTMSFPAAGAGGNTFGAFYAFGSVRVGSGFGTGVTSTTVTLGTGPATVGPGGSITFRNATNIAAGQALEVVSQAISQGALNFDSGFNAGGLPNVNIRALGSGVLGVGGATIAAANTIDLRRFGDGTFRLGGNIGGTGTGTIAGTVLGGGAARVAVGGSASGPPLVRVGALNGSTLTFSGTNSITGSAGLDVGSPLINGGVTTYAGGNQTGVIVLSAANNYTGGTTVNRSSTLQIGNGGATNPLGTGPVSVFGTLTANGANGRFTNAAGTANNNAISLYGGSTVILDNSSLAAGTILNRWGDTSPVDLTASSLTLSSPAAGVYTLTETVGAFSFAGGSILTLNRSGTTVANQNIVLAASSFARVGPGTLELTRNGGTGAGFGGGQQVTVASGAPVVTNGMVAPYYAVNGVTELTTFASYGANGFTAVAFANFDAVLTTGSPAGTFTAGLTAGTQKVYVDFATANTTLTLADNPILYALKLGGGTASTTIAIGGTGTADTITLRSGGLIVSADVTAGNFSTDGTRTVNLSPNLVFNNGTSNIEALINTRNAYTLNATGTLTAAGLTKFGAGTLSIFADGAATLTGTTAVNQGVLNVFGTAVTNANFSPGGTGTYLLNGGQLNVRTANAAGTTFATSNNGSYVQQTGVAVAAGIPIAVLDINRSGADTTSSGSFTFNPISAGGPGLVLNGSPGPQGQTFTLSGANYTATFGDNAANTFAGNVTINNAQNLFLNNGPTITGTNPVITKTAGGNWIVGVTNGSPSVALGTTVVLNAGTLELRNPTALGTGDTTTFALNAGTLNLRLDNTGLLGTTGAGTRYPVVVNGNATISSDRITATNANYSQGLGALTINGNPTLTFNAGNGVYPTFTSVNLLGTPIIASNVAPGSIETAVQLSNVSGGALVKAGTGHLHLMTANTYDGGTYAQQGMLRVRAAGALGTGPVFLNPGALMDFNSTYAFAAGQTLTVRSNSAYLPMISMTTNNPHPTTGVNTSGAPVGIIGLGNQGSATAFDTVINLSAMYGGGWYLGAVPAGAYDGRYTATSLGAGNGNVFRLGGGGGSLNIGYDNSGNSQFFVMVGGASAQFGLDSGNILPVNGLSFRIDLGGPNAYSGSTVIHRGTAARLGSGPSGGGQSGFGTGAINVFGGLGLGSNGTLQFGGNPTNTLILHPGATFALDNNGGIGIGGASNLNGRFVDTVPLVLNGALVDVIGSNNNTTMETFGDVTIARGARIRAARNGSGSVLLTLTSLSGLTAGNTLALLSSGAGQLGNATVSDRIFVTNNPPAVVNGMVDPRIVSQTDNSFVTYGATGFAPIGFDKTVNATYAAGSLLPTDKVDVVTAALNLADNPTVYALRTSQNINIAGPYNSIAIRSGGLIGTGGTIQPNLVFNNGTQNIEARIYNTGTVTLNGLLTANGVTKFGNGTLVIGGAQPQYASGWTINAGVLQTNDLLGLGQSVAGNAIVLNATQTTGGALGQSFAATQLTFSRDLGTPEVAVFTGGPITVVNEGILRFQGGTTVADRNVQIPVVTAVSTGAGSSVALTLDVPNNRFRGIVPTLTLSSNTTLRVYDNGSQADFGRVTAAVVNSLVGNGVNLTKIGNRTLELPNDNTATFLASTITVAQGTVRVWHNGALGNAASTTTVQRNAALEIGVSNFAPTATVVLLPGAVERWDVPGARGTSGTYNLPSGVNLQLNTNIPNSSTLTVGLNGGSVEGFLFTDHPAQTADRIVGTGVTFNLLANSFIGSNIIQGQGYDTGRQPTVFQPFANTATGAVLRINGNITGSAFDLTKTGFDTVVIAGAANTYRNTFVDIGLLRIGRTDALPAGGTLTTRFAGVFDLYGFNQTVAGLGTLTGGSNPGGVGLGFSGQVLNSAVQDATLTVNNTADFTYNGTLDRTVALTKAGAGTLLIGSANNSYIGATTINAGALSVAVLANGGVNSSIGASTNAAANLAFGGGTLRYTGGTVTTDRGFTLNAGGGTVDVTTAATALTLSGAGTGAGGLSKAGPGTLILTAANTYAGTTAVNAGTLRAGAVGTLPAASAVTTANAAGVVLDLNGFNQTVASLAGGGATGGNTTLGAATLTLGGSTTNSYGGVVSGAGGLTRAGTGVTVLTAANTYGGATTINGGVLRNGIAGALPAGTAVTLANVAGATLDLNGFNQTVASLAGGGATGGNVTLGVGTLTLAGSANTTFAGAISGAGGLTRNASGTTTLTGANTYAGPTTIAGGSVALSGSGSFAASSVVAVGTGTTLDVAAVTGGANFDAGTNRFALAGSQTLRGTGTVAGGVTVASGTTLAPGTPAAFGTLAVTGSATIANNGTLAAKLGAVGTADTLNLTGASATLNFVSGSKLVLTDGGGFAGGTYGNFTLATMASGNGGGIQLDGIGAADGAVLGHFVVGTGNVSPVAIDTTGLTGLTAGEHLVLSRSGDFVILSYQPVPEPATVLGFAAAAAGLGGLLRRLRRRTV